MLRVLRVILLTIVTAALGASTGRGIANVAIAVKMAHASATAAPGAIPAPLQRSRSTSVRYVLDANIVEATVEQADPVYEMADDSDAPFLGASCPREAALFSRGEPWIYASHFASCTGLPRGPPPT